jgi:primosomal protein N' (replication factor Y)
LGCSKKIIGGVIIDGLSIKWDLFYYKIPPDLIKLADIGAKVIVPFGANNELHSGFLFSIKNVDTYPKNIKEIKSISENKVFDSEIRDLLRFTADKYFIPLHIIVNKLLKNLSTEILRRYVNCLNCEALMERSKDLSQKGKEVANIILRKKTFPVSLLRKRFGNSYNRVLNMFEKEGLIERTNISERISKKYLFLDIPRENALNLVNDISDKKLRNAVMAVISRLLRSAVPLREDALKRGIPYGKKAITFLLSSNKISEKIFTNFERDQNKRFSIKILYQGSLIERTEKIAEIIKDDQSARVLIIFPEIAAIERVKNIYKREFKNNVYVWSGKSKKELVEAIYINNKRVILATPSALFIKIPYLKYLIVEDAASKYLERGDFLLFDARVVSIKKAEIEKLSLVFSTSVPTVSMYYLIQKRFAEEEVLDGKNTKVLHLIDMRKEFKSKNYKMLSLPVQREINKVLQKDGNVALLLNRKSYSTFVMCRECGYVLRCPNCGVPLYYDKEKNELFCPICGYREKPPNLCPRCGSPNIAYFAGGLQKLKEQVVELFPHAKIVELMSEKTRHTIILNASNYKHTIFMGTEYMLSHLILNNVKAFVFVSIDIFLNHYCFNASSETFALIGKTLFEMQNGKIFIQSYVPENFVLKASKNMDYKSFFGEELSLREIAMYPPFSTVIIFTFYGKDRTEVLEYAEEFKARIVKNIDDINVLGPSPSFIEKKGNTYFFELTVKTEKLSLRLRDFYIEAVNEKSSVQISVASYLSVKEYTGQEQ